MGMKGCGITPYSSTFGSGANKGLGYNRRIGPSDSAPTMKVAFRTETTTARTFNVWVRASAVKKYGADPNSNSFVHIGSFGWDYYNRSTASAADAAVSSTRSRFSYTGSPGNYTWTIPFSSLPMSGDSSKTLASVLGSMAFASRSYDCICLEVSVRALWGDKLEGRTDAAAATCYIGFIPTFAPASDSTNAAGAWVDDAGDLYLCVGEPSTWMRMSDRWEVDQAIKVGGKELVAAKSVWGSSVIHRASGMVLLKIPKAKLKFAPQNGSAVTAGRVRFAGSWQSSDGSAVLAYCTWPSSTAAANLVKNLKQAKTADTSIGGSSSNTVTPRTPTITAVRSGRNVKVTVGQNTSTGNTALTSIEVQMVGGTTAFDTAVLAPGGSHVFYGVPFGVATTWEATAYAVKDDVEYQGKTVSATVAAISMGEVEGIPLVNVSGREVVLHWGVSRRRSSSPEHEVLKLAGRERPTVAYGEGGTVEWAIDAKVFTSAVDGVDAYDEDDIISMPMDGPWLVRDAGGGRTMLAVTEATVSGSRPDLNPWRQVSITAQEVA